MLSIDVESTGTDPVQDRIFQIGLASERSSTRLWINPEREIPAEVVELCRLTPETLEMIRRSPTFGQAVGLFALELQRESVWIGFGIARFDVPLLSEEFARAKKPFPIAGKSVVDFQELYKQKNPRRLENFFLDYTGEELEDAHDALADAEAVMRCVDGFMSRHPELKSLSFRELAVMSAYGRLMVDPAGKFSTNESGVVVFSFGKYKDEPIANRLDYLRWMIGAEFPQSTKVYIRKFLDRVEMGQSPGLFDEENGVASENPF